MFQFNAFGLRIRSEIPFANENGKEADYDVSIEINALSSKWLEDERANAGYVTVEDDNIWFVWNELGVMKIHAGRSIIIDPVSNVKKSLLNQAIQSAGLGLLLHQRNELTLHASAVEVGDGVVAFVGYKGAGKSTTAASLFARGCPLVTDDLLVLDIPAAGAVSAYPGIPQLRLWPEAVVASLGEDPELLPRNSDLSVKRLRDVEDQFAIRPQPLRAIYVLDFNDETESQQVLISPLAARDACVELVRHSYALHYLGNEGASMQHLSKSQTLTKSVPIRHLKRPRALHAIPEMVDAILNDLDVGVNLKF